MKAKTLGMRNGKSVKAVTDGKKIMLFADARSALWRTDAAPKGKALEAAEKMMPQHGIPCKTAVRTDKDGFPVNDHGVWRVVARTTIHLV